MCLLPLVYLFDYLHHCVMLDVSVTLWPLMQCCCLLCCLSHFSFGHRELFQVGSCFPCGAPSFFVPFLRHLFCAVSLTFWQRRILILYLPSPSPGIRHLSKDPFRFCLLGNGMWKSSFFGHQIGASFLMYLCKYSLNILNTNWKQSFLVAYYQCIK